jgi:hypothetical protein
MRTFRLSIGLLVAALVWNVDPARAEAPSIQPFLGSYEGTTLLQSGEVKNRELRVIIRPFGQTGFTVRWRTLIFKPGKEPTGRTQVVYFEPSASNPKIYAATPPEEAAGIASDQPLAGRPFGWARVVGKTLTVNVLTISEAGDYVVQTYNRTLTKTGLALAFVRVSNGEVEQRIWGELERVGD